VTKAGQVHEAREAVIGAIHPHDLGRMVEGIDAGVVRAAEATRISPIACITVHAALQAPLRFRAGMPVQAVMTELLPTQYEQLRRSFDDLRYGGFPQYPLIGFGSLSTFDPSRVPEGRATLHAWDYVPYERSDGRSWDDTKRDYAERMIDHMARFIENIGHENILKYHCDSPVDMERTSPSFRRGDLHGVATTTYQSGAHRPTPELGQYTVPGVERLYLVGPFQHPGGGVFGAGRATAIKLAADLKMDLARVPRRALRRIVDFAMSRAFRLASRL
jgi:phytoene dehydrogenase-like protein